MRRVLVLGATVAVLAAGCGSTTGYSAATPSAAKQLLTARLKAHYLSVRWIACVRNGRVYHGAEIVRCNVDFGDPHIEAYCALLRGGRLVTDHDDPAIPCRHDGAGWAAPIVGS